MELIREKFRKQYSSSGASVLLDRVSLTSYDDSVITMSVDSEFTYKILAERYIQPLEQAFTEILGFQVQVKLINTGAPVDAEKIKRQLRRDAFGHTDDEKYEAEKKRREQESGDSYSEGFSVSDTSSSAPSATASAIPAQASIAPDGSVVIPAYNFEYTFENFIVGSSNKFAHAACLAVVDKPARDYNPLFIYGPSGIGKTHLLWATMNGLKKRFPRIRMVYIKSEDFINEMIDCISRQEMKKFRDKYRSCDVLLIDDIQFIAGKVSTQEEFFHTFNALYESKKQIILTSDRPPREIQHLEDRLKSRFEWGLMADIQAPDLELRMAIIKKKAEQVSIPINDEILVYLAENLRSNIRQLEGAIKKLAAFHFLGREITMDMARGCITELLGGAEPQSVTLAKIFAAVTKKFNVSKEDLVGKKRSGEIAFARHVTMFMIRQITEMSLPNIGKIFDRDHSTVMSSIEKIERKYRTDQSFASEYNELRREVTGA